MFLAGRSVVLAGVLACASVASAQAPAGGEFRVNTYTGGDERVFGRTIAADATGAFVVVWSGAPPAADGDVFGRRYDARGTPRGSEFRINSFTTSTQDRPIVAMSRKGDFIVVWASWDQDAPATYGVFAQRFDSAGLAVGGEFQVNVFTTGTQFPEDVAMDPHGGFIVTWIAAGQDGDVGAVFARRYDRNGVSIGGEFQVNTYTSGYQFLSSTDVDAAGNFVVVWDSEFQDGSYNGVFGQRFDASGARRGGEFRINDHTTHIQGSADVAVRPDGSFVVVWHSLYQDGSGYGIFARRFDAAGSPVGGEMPVNAGTMDQQRIPVVGSDDIGNFVVAWMTDAGPGGDNLMARRFSADGAASSGDFRLNTYTTEAQVGPAIAVDAVGNFVVDWESYDQDGFQWGVYAQRFGGLCPAALRLDTAGNGVLEPGETSVSMRPSWVNQNGAPQMFIGQLANPSGPPGGVPGISLGQAIYGIVPDGATGECSSCYTLFVPAPSPRPVVHWDATADERILPMILGQHKRWTLHVGESFTDVPRASAFYRFVETLLHHGVTGGCTATSFCPAANTTREQMPVFVLVAKEGASYIPPPCGTTPLFDDVPVTSPFCRWIEELARRGVVNGCGAGRYCPTANVTRDQMAVFVLRTLDPTLIPPTCTTPVFADVPASSPFCRWVEELARRAVVSGCGGGNYCPSTPVTREQMGVFIGMTFGLTLYGP